MIKETWVGMYNEWGPTSDIIWLDAVNFNHLFRYGNKRWLKINGWYEC